MRSRISLRAIGLAASALLLSSAAHADPRLFSLYGLAGWEPKNFIGRAATLYKPVVEGRVQVIEAQCDNSASGLMWRDRIDLTTTPVLAWRWKVDSLFAGLDERTGDGDDFPARVYAVRSGGAFPWMKRTMMYVWSNGEQGLEDWPSGNGDSTHIVAVRSGAEGVGEWQAQRRDLRADFKKYFDLELETLDAVAVMSDCDDHEGKGKAWFGDIRLLEP